MRHLFLPTFRVLVGERAVVPVVNKVPIVVVRSRARIWANNHHGRTKQSAPRIGRLRGFWCAEGNPNHTVYFIVFFIVDKNSAATVTTIFNKKRSVKFFSHFTVTFGTIHDNQSITIFFILVIVGFFSDLSVSITSWRKTFAR